MNKIIPLPKAVLLAAMLLFSLVSYCQLPNFTMTLGSTPETCNGNGSITIAVTGNNPSAIMQYRVYLLPDELNSITTVNAGPVLNLAAGSYKVVATQSLGAQFNTQTGFVTIADNTIPLDFQIAVTNPTCPADGKITVNITSGSAVSYQIIAPLLMPVQTSNVFTGLAAGTYRVKIFTACNDNPTRDVILTPTPRLITIDPPEFVPGQLPGCNTMAVGHFFGTTTGNNIIYPVTFTFTVFPPGGGTPTVITQTVATGNNNGGNVFVNIPFYHGQAYSYNVVATDACGTNYSRNNNFVNKQFAVAGTPSIINCDENIFSIIPSFFRAPYTVTFSSAPAGFNPQNFNASHPTFTGTANYGGTGNPVPEGDYTVSVTDACGRIATNTFRVEDPEIDANGRGEVEGCSPTGTIFATVPNRVIATVVVTEGPAGYPVPHDISESVGPTGLERSNMPVGHYELVITDTCGDTYTVEFDMAPVAGNPVMAVMNRPGCTPERGSVRVTLPGDSTYSSVTITSAPADFPHPLPYTATSLALGSNFFMNDVPEGVYHFTTVDNCGVTRNQDVIVQGYEIQNTNVTISPVCNAFSITLQHSSNGMVSASFWLQKFNPATNTWEHPATGVDYVEGTLPSPQNSVMLLNNATTNNHQYNGEFRIIKVFYTFGNGTVTNQRCQEVIHTFNFSGRPEIVDAYSFPCANGLIEVALVVEGVGPFTYRIIEKNNQEFIVNNGSSNIYTGLEPATYLFEVIDICDANMTRPFTINTVVPPAITPTGFCEGEDSSLAVEAFSSITYQWWEESDPATILSTGNVLNFPSFNSATDTGTYHVKLISSNPNSCMGGELTPFTVVPNNIPNAGNDVPNIELCSNSSTVNLDTYLTAGHDAGGTWEDTNGTGKLAGSMLNTDGLSTGTYNFKYTVAGDCGLTDDATITVTVKQRPLAPLFTQPGNICEGETVVFAVNTVPGAVYSWTGPNNFTSSLQNPVIPNAGLQAAGVYEVTVTVNGCTSPPSQISVIVSQRPNLTITGNNQLCTGQTTTLTAQLHSIHQASIVEGWFLDDVQLQGEYSLTINAAETGEYKFVMSSGGCIGEARFTVLPGSVDADIILDAGCNDKDNYVLRVVNTQDFPNATYNWAGPAGYTAVGEEAVITGLSNGDYVVTVDMGGCIKSQPLTVLNTFCKIPKGISPNGDEYNNNFDLSNFDVKQLKIFNRYGMRVYEKENYINEWYGQSFVGELPTGTYYYVVQLASGKKVTGWVYLQREI